MKKSLAIVLMLMWVGCRYAEDDLAGRLNGHWKLVHVEGDSLIFDTISLVPLTIDTIRIDPLTNKKLTRIDSTLHFFRFFPCENAYTSTCKVEVTLVNLLGDTLSVRNLNYTLKGNELSFISNNINMLNQHLFSLVRYKIEWGGPTHFYFNGILNPKRILELQEFIP